jgi:putative protease
METPKNLPSILAPAGSKPSFLAALAAGADAVYCGLKSFSARMEAQNFTLEELASLTALAHAKGTRVYVTLNTLIKPDELDAVGGILDQLARHVGPDAVIVQDLAMAALVRQTGFAGEVHWSTLSNMSFPAALKLVAEKLPVHSVVLPRELTVDEMKAVAYACPPSLSLETFIHGALCYGVSGRCYWSSFLGGRSGLRGRCVQPCRRVYAQEGNSRRLFSCLDLSVDVLVKVLMGIPQIRTWKIEGRKKGPHYVYYVVTGYRLLRDHAGDPQAKKDALHYLSRALGRPGTHYYFLPQRPQNPLDATEQTGSGLLVGRVKGAARQAFLNPQHDLLSGDLLRVGYEDAPGHRIERVGRSVPKGGRYSLPESAAGIPKGTPVFLIDRREKALEDLLQGLSAQAPDPPGALRPSAFRARLPQRAAGGPRPEEVRVYRHPPRQAGHGRMGLWLSGEAVSGVPAPLVRRVCWWLPPVVFPDDEASLREWIGAVRSSGAGTFVLNDPWQVCLFPRQGQPLRLWAGPFCNLANPLALETAAGIGFDGAIVSPELAAADFMKLPGRSPLPLGVVVGGHWPLCVARAASADLRLETPFRSPKGEEAWTTRHGSLHWVFPNWRVRLQDHVETLRRAGYSWFVHLMEPVPKGVQLKDRPGLWNWEGELK